MVDKKREKKCEIQNNFSNNLKDYLKYYSMSQADLAKKIGTTQQAINNWINNGISPRFDKIDKICNVFHCEKSDLLESKEIDFFVPNRIKVLGKIPAGIPIEAIEDVIDYEEIPEKWCDGVTQYFGLKVSGDSMFPKYMDGDTIICKKCSNFENGQDAVVFVDEYNATLKKIIKQDDCIILEPLNPMFDPRSYKIAEHKIQVAGIVVELRRKI